ncbi:MAG: hypothetical protein OXI01_13055 [Albidovulum sp.]|nr:hypothetical protein [Albidovulum sp.]
MDIQSAKEIAWGMATTLRPDMSRLSEDLLFYGPAPIEFAGGGEETDKLILEPLRRAMPRARKRPYIFLGSEYGGSIWIATTGNIEGEMEASWLGIPAGQGLRKLRFGEFYRVDGERIVEIRCLFDIPGLAAQAGIEMLPKFEGLAHIPKGPKDGEAVIRMPQDPAESDKTRLLVTEMITNGCNRLNGSDLRSQRLERFWTDDMAWHGPWGIGSSYGIDQFYRFAQSPSVKSFPGRRGSWPKLAFPAEGPTAAFTGWPGLIGEFTGEPFRGIEPTYGPIGQTVMDFYFRRGDRLAENWVLIDLVKFASDCGVDLMSKLRDGSYKSLERNC